MASMPHWLAMMTTMCLIGVPSLPADGAGEDKAPPKLPGITVDRKAGTVDVDATIAARDAFLELIACTANTKEHEALVSIEARAQHVHLALMLLGAKPGSPSRWVYDEKADAWRGIAPRGTPVRLSLMIEEDEGWVEKRLTDYVVDAEKKPLTSDTFVFGGSKLRKVGEDKPPIYEADASGNFASLVSFGDETLSWPTAASTSNEQLEWYTNTGAIPDVGTKVKLRLTPVVKKKPK